MASLEKFHGILPAFYACYNDEGNISEARTKELCEYLLGKGVQGVYVGGSSGECIYHNLDERIAALVRWQPMLSQKSILSSAILFMLFLFQA
ncbi:dihydrodipicolinate synthase family protein [Paenibacillus bouchesdurhonensis]|uniref:dihydrodipicolinate synthase family protein n=1 Tax=Paenibacillus bouchesdurhonensis TaxID=1870990 RepID=UPI000DA5F162|nr:dihydrodipicolinate synthase family protein [Paenibacillus bouchesdurhonensis]